MSRVTDSQGVQTGNGNVQINLFSGEQPRGPVVAGNVPQAPPAFQPREDLMAQLRAAGPGVRVVRVVTGMRGVGKTQLAAAYARECVDAGWRLVAWVSAEDTPGLLGGLAVVADRLGIGKPGTDLEVIAAEVRNRLEADGDRCLIVYDDVTDPDALHPYVPSAGKSQVVVTSTQSSALDLGRPAQVDVFTGRESLDFLTERTQLHDPAGAAALASEVGHLPLALAQAAAVIRAQHLTYPVYLARLRAYPIGKYLPAAKGDRYPRGVAAAIGLSIDAVTAADPSGRCGDLLGVISLLSPEGVSRELLQGGEPSGVLGGAAELDESLARLADASLLTFGGAAADESEPTVTAHRLVMRVAREHRAGDGTLAGVGTRAFDLIAAAFESLGEPWRRRAAARGLVRQVLALNDHLAAHLGAGDGADDNDLAEGVLALRGWAFWCLNALADNPAQAVGLGESLVADIERMLGESHPNTLASRNNLAAAYLAAGRPADAVLLHERSMTDQVRVLGDSHPDTLASRNNLAAAYLAAGRPADAVLADERTLADRMRVLGESHPDTLVSRSNLAAAYRAAGRPADAALLYERTLADRMRVLGGSHPDTLTSRNNLAVAWLAAGRAADAVPLLERTLADRMRVLGESHPDTLVSRSNLGAAYLAAGRAADAVPLAERTLADRERMLGESHPATLASRDNLAVVREAARST